MNNHTPAPWRVNHYDAHGCRREIAGDTGHVAICEAEEDAERIVACVNACEGIATDAFKEFPDGKIVGMLVLAQQNVQVLRDIRAERDELAREALRAKQNAGKFAAALLNSILDEIEDEDGDWLLDDLAPELEAIKERLDLAAAKVAS